MPTLSAKHLVYIVYYSLQQSREVGLLLAHFTDEETDTNQKTDLS